MSGDALRTWRTNDQSEKVNWVYLGEMLDGMSYRMMG